MGIFPLKKRVNRDKCSFATKQRMFGVFAIDEILRYRGSRIPGSPTLCHPARGCYFILVTDICLPNEQTVARNKETSEKNSFETTCAFSQIHQDLMEKESCLIIPQRYLEENFIYKEKRR